MPPTHDRKRIAFYGLRESSVRALADWPEVSPFRMEFWSYGSAPWNTRLASDRAKPLDDDIALLVVNIERLFPHRWLEDENGDGGIRAMLKKVAESFFESVLARRRNSRKELCVVLLRESRPVHAGSHRANRLRMEFDRKLVGLPKSGPCEENSPEGIQERKPIGRFEERENLNAVAKAIHRQMEKNYGSCRMYNLKRRADFGEALTKFKKESTFVVHDFRMLSDVTLSVVYARVPKSIEFPSRQTVAHGCAVIDPREQRFGNTSAYSHVDENDRAISACLEEVAVYGLRPYGIPYVGLDSAETLEYVRRVQEACRCYGGGTHAEAIDFLGQSPAFKRLCRDLCLAARTDGHILLVGETGTGKEACAKILHRLREAGGNDRGYSAVNCAFFQGDPLVSQIFGHKKGAYTGATEDREGVIRKDSKGTVFLDEIQSADSRLHALLMRFMSNGSFYRLGDTKEYFSQQRLVAATNKCEFPGKPELIASGFIPRFSAIVHLPPLRDRQEDIPLLVDHRLAELASARGIAEESVYAEANEFAPFFGALKQEIWKEGNVRQLQRSVEGWFHKCFQTNESHASENHEPIADEGGKRGRRFKTTTHEILSRLKRLEQSLEKNTRMPADKIARECNFSNMDALRASLRNRIGRAGAQNPEEKECAEKAMKILDSICQQKGRPKGSKRNGSEGDTPTPQSSR